MTYEILIRREGQQYRAVCPQLPGLSATAASAGAALDAAQQRLEQRLAERGLSPPAVTEVRASLQSDTQLA